MILSLDTRPGDYVDGVITDVYVDNVLVFSGENATPYEILEAIVGHMSGIFLEPLGVQVYNIFDASGRKIAA